MDLDNNAGLKNVLNLFLTGWSDLENNWKYSSGNYRKYLSAKQFEMLEDEGIEFDRLDRDTDFAGYIIGDLHVEIKIHYINHLYLENPRETYSMSVYEANLI